jgi:hypothetical protein
LARKLSAVLSVLTAWILFAAQPAWAWGDEGHRIVALIAQTHLTPSARQQIDAMLAADTDPLTAHDMINAATWADRYRDSDRNTPSRARYLGTRNWHFVDIERFNPDFNKACFHHPGLPVGVPASAGPANSCVVDKIDQFTAELANPATDPRERVMALKFLLHFVGDLHQPLHAADDHDQGGNKKGVSTNGIAPGNLHHYWDTEFIRLMSPDANQVAATLTVNITPAQRAEWATGRPADWAKQSYELARDHAYGLLPPPNPSGNFLLTDAYVEQAKHDVALQLSRAGVRLAVVLNSALTPPSNASLAR